MVENPKPYGVEASKAFSWRARTGGAHPQGDTDDIQR
jgi:hypothetical protein